MSKTTSDELADQWPPQVYITSFLALLNARYYLQPEYYSGTANTPQSRTIYRRELEAEKPQETRKIVCQRPYDQDGELHPARPVRVIVVSSLITVDRRGLSDAL
jgi:hypothetical protein